MLDTKTLVFYLFAVITVKEVRLKDTITMKQLTPNLRWIRMSTT